METLRIKLSALTKLERLHHSQNIFGYLCYKIMDTYDESMLEAMLSDIDSGKKTLNISSIMPENTLFWPSLTVNYSDKSMFDTVTAKQIKKIKYASFNALKTIIHEPYIGDVLSKALKEQSMVVNKDLLMLEGELNYNYDLGVDIRYSSKEETPFNIKSYGIDRQSKFEFYIKTDIEEIIELVKNLKLINLGKYKHTGLNTYEVEKVDSVSLSSDNQFILLSKFIPSEDDVFDKDESLVKIDYLGSRLDNRMLETYDTRHKDFFSAISEGSYLVSNQDRLGTLKKRNHASKVSGKTVYYNGFAFLYPVGDIQ